jgi:hypothetical protein
MVRESEISEHYSASIRLIRLSVCHVTFLNTKTHHKTTCASVCRSDARKFEAAQRRDDSNNISANARRFCSKSTFTMGFETELFVKQPVDDNLMCHICHDVLEKPTTICGEGHMFCADCVHDWMMNRNDCPECRNPTTSRILCRPVQNMIMDLQVNCPEVVKYEVKETNKDDTKRAKKEGDKDVGTAKRSITEKTCGWQGTLTDYLERHRLHECRYREVQCDLGCNEMIRVCDLETHKTTQCSHRIVTCTLCKDKMQQMTLHEHCANQCPEMSAHCEYCGEKMLRKLLGNKPDGLAMDDPPKGTTDLESQYSGHYKTCPDLHVKCEFFEQGCYHKIKRKDLGKHHEKFGRVHARLVAEAINNIRNDKDWSFKEFFWTIPKAVVEEALEEPDLLFVEESQRVKVGDYFAFLRLTIDQGVVSVNACVDRPPFCPSIDSLEVEVEHRNGTMNMEEEQQMVKDAGGSRTWSVGGVLRIEDESGTGGRDVTTDDLDDWCDSSDLVLRASFRLKGPESVSVQCKR